MKTTNIPTLSPPSSQLLPSDMMAAIFDFAGTPIHEIMRIGVSNRFVSKEVMPKLTRLVIWRTQDLDIPTTRKILLTMDEVTDIDFCCLIKLADESDIDSAQQYDVEASHRIPSFLTQFPKIKRIFLGGNRTLPVLATYEPYRCSSPEDHREYHHGLLWSLCGAFRTRVLPQDLQIDGLVYSGIYCLWNRDQEEPERCTFCKAILEYFPIPLIIKYAIRSRGDSNLCFNERQIYEKLMKRSESDLWTMIMNDTIQMLVHQDDILAISFMPSAAERINNMHTWGLVPDCSKEYWRHIRAKFTQNRITRTAFTLLQLVDPETSEDVCAVVEASESIIWSRTITRPA